MKTFKEFLQEKWVSDIVKRGSSLKIDKNTTSYPIYENPSSKDLVELRKSGLENDLVRFAAIQSKKKIYVWSGMHVIHDDALNKLVKDKVISRTNHNNLDQALCGECHLIGGRLSFAKNDGMDSYFGPMVFPIRKKMKTVNDDIQPLPEPYYEFKDLVDDLPNIIKRYQWISKFIDEYETQSSPAILQKLIKT